ncbi:hypothetical protein RLOC_00002071 [Lonchura striata]|uniref:Uncharacterized protein n=1 Tax=Lonchura striata TaxID=40157 RepID=A0A218V3A4_9PASE|nr:hypothetical protein RLOC_00002071 [Lonchura striata domestica]
MELLEQVQCKAMKMIKEDNRLRELGLFSLKNRQLRGEVTNIYKHLKEGGQEDGARPFSLVPSNRPKGNEQKLMHRKFHLNMRKNFTVQVAKHWNRLPRELAAVITAGLLLLYILLCYEDFHFHMAHVYACLGYPDAQHILGQRYLQGAGVEKNEDMAMHWFRFRVLQGSGETPQCGSSSRAPRSSATFGKHLQEQKSSLNDCCNTNACPTSPSSLSNPTFSLLSV